MELKQIQSYLQDHQLNGWLMADFHGRNEIFTEALKLTGMITRRSFYLVPAEGEPVGIVHAIERDKFDDVAGKIITYSGYKELEGLLKELVSGYDKLAMEYSPGGRLPYVALVDAGTIELIRSFGPEIVTSADLVANFQARLSVEQMAAHRIAANNVVEIKFEAFKFIAKSLKSNKSITEYDVVQFILGRFKHYDMETLHAPVCAVDGNAGNPHYEPSAERAATIKEGNLILIDLWAKMSIPDGVYGDITWMAYAGTKDQIPQKYTDLFATLIKARDAAIDHVHNHVEAEPLNGADVDDACRAVIEKAGYGKHFTHRTGHSIGSEVHSTGPNIDNLETEDGRKLQQGHLFSIEPGMYFDDCGMRSEINMLIGHNGGEVTTLPLQTEILALL